MALLWIAKGLLSWAVIVGLAQARLPFEARSTGFQATMIYFAVIDLVAAVGLWLNSTLGRGALAPRRDEPPDPRRVLPPHRRGRAVLVALSLALIGVYLAVSWLAAGEERA